MSGDLRTRGIQVITTGDISARHRSSEGSSQYQETSSACKLAMDAGPCYRAAFTHQGETRGAMWTRERVHAFTSGTGGLARKGRKDSRERCASVHAKGAHRSMRKGRIGSHARDAAVSVTVA